LREVKDSGGEPNQVEGRSDAFFTDFSGERKYDDLGASLPRLDWNKEMNALPKFKRDFYTVSKMIIIQKDSFKFNFVFVGTSKPKEIKGGGDKKTKGLAGD